RMLLPTVLILMKARVDFLRKFFLSPIRCLRLKTFCAFGTNGKMSAAKPSPWHIGTLERRRQLRFCTASPTSADLDTTFSKYGTGSRVYQDQSFWIARGPDHRVDKGRGLFGQNGCCSFAVSSI